jgi:Helix-turn-helix domain
MSEYLVRWKFGPNSLLNPLDVETAWYYQFHVDKIDAVNHFTELLFHASPAMKVTAEIFELVNLMKDESEVVDHNITELYDKGLVDVSFVVLPDSSDEPEIVEETRDERIVRLYNNGKGKTRREIATEMGLSYQTIYAVTRKSQRSQK